MADSRGLVEKLTAEGINSVQAAVIKEHFDNEQEEVQVFGPANGIRDFTDKISSIPGLSLEQQIKAMKAIEALPQRDGLTVEQKEYDNVYRGQLMAWRAMKEAEAHDAKEVKLPPSSPPPPPPDLASSPPPPPPSTPDLASSTGATPPPPPPSTPMPSTSSSTVPDIKDDGAKIEADRKAAEEKKRLADAAAVAEAEEKKRLAAGAPDAKTADVALDTGDKQNKQADIKATMEKIKGLDKDNNKYIDEKDPAKGVKIPYEKDEKGNDKYMDCTQGADGKVNIKLPRNPTPPGGLNEAGAKKFLEQAAKMGAKADLSKLTKEERKQLMEINAKHKIGAELTGIPTKEKLERMGDKIEKGIKAVGEVGDKLAKKIDDSRLGKWTREAVRVHFDDVASRAHKAEGRDSKPATASDVKAARDSVRDAVELTDFKSTPRSPSDDVSSTGPVGPSPTGRRSE